MAHDDLILAPENLDALVAGLGEMALALGPTAAAGLDAVRSNLLEAQAAQAAGERDRAVIAITRAMRQLADLARAIDPNESAMMRAIATQFDAALRRGDAGEAAQSVDQMRERSGARKKRGDENKL